MRAQIEVELKWWLSGIGYARASARLTRLLGPGVPLEQRNAFFDSDDGRLRNAGLACRVRREAARTWLTCKGRLAADRHGASRHVEHEMLLSSDALHDIERDPQHLIGVLPEAWRAALGDGRLRALGGFRNQRRQWRDGSTLLCLDRTTFAHRVDHELELEGPHPQRAAARWRALFSQWGIAVQAQTLGKATRMFSVGMTARPGVRRSVPGRP